MLYALATPGSAFKPSLKKMSNTWRLQKFKTIYLEKGGSPNSSGASSAKSTASIESSSSESVPHLNSKDSLRWTFANALELLL
ncbi:uncharacterized protein CANTADRAFT_12566 [Suhomyces tanzawaensis NRRL Y-17324]|uniref:Uncharacterized protein n=1 Tax=Suhomyces tanzawaensis NRRL Y-17324 TaxID=984487 RepID=A0A1E4SEZ7_9ASCO|nr:uncharacterized protein CANTADRAFT_12566 [Suhomyces tanzawaensis NRRL Y-17324]ODV77972.1 hypothetical protein CANTADRAFT_12566 [Suhomyces tanzawaensis NRRL Y-17324]